MSSKGAIRRFLGFVLGYMLNIERVGKASLLKAVLDERISIELLTLKNITERYNDLLDKLHTEFIDLLQQLYHSGKSLVITGNHIEVSEKRSSLKMYARWESI